HSGDKRAEKEGNAHSDVYGADAPSQDTASSDYQVETSVAMSDVGTLEHPRDVGEIALEIKRIADLAKGYDRSGEVCTVLFLVVSTPRPERLQNRQKRNDQRFTPHGFLC